MGKAMRKEKSKISLGNTIKKDFKKNWMIWLMALPFVVWYLVFMYAPMFGVSIAFQRFSIAKGVFGSPWIGLDNFIQFFSSYFAGRIIKNTLVLSLCTLVFVFPAPIILSILLNEVACKPLKKAVQTITYLPYFISLVVACGMVTVFVSKEGLVNQLMGLFGHAKDSSLLIYPEYYRTIYVVSEVWKTIGWNSIIYLAALAGINQEYYEAAMIDGANRFQKIIHITIPSLMPTIVTMLILNIGNFMSVGADKTILLYNENTFEVSDIIASFVYRRGIVEADYSFSAAVGLFNGVINLILVVITNFFSKKVTGEGLW